MFTRGYVTNPGFFWPWDVHPHHNPHPKGPRLVTTLSLLEVPIAVLVRVIILKDLRGQFFLRSRGIPGGTFGRCGNLDIQLSRYQMLPATPCYLFDGPFFFDASGAPSPYENLGLSGVFNMNGWWDSTWLDQRRHGTDGFFTSYPGDPEGSASCPATVTIQVGFLWFACCVAGICHFGFLVANNSVSKPSAQCRPNRAGNQQGHGRRRSDLPLPSEVFVHLLKGHWRHDERSGVWNLLSPAACLLLN